MIKKILKKEAEKRRPENEILDKLDRVTNSFLSLISKEIKKNKIKGDVFLGGSWAKGTIINKKKYDIDIYLRFDKSYQEKELSNLLAKILKKEKKRKIHGSRDYFEIIKEGILFEIIPITRIKKPEEARNVTDLSPFHVSYVKKCIQKNKRLADEIRLAKTFCYAQEIYGAESYIRGFSGYALELLMCHYGSFLKFLQEMVKVRDKVVLDSKKFYKGKSGVMNELNASKLQSPIILIDPTFKQRNALAGLSKETFDKFRIVASRFLKNPSQRFFEKQEFDLTGFKKKVKKGEEFVAIKAKTNKQEGDIAGGKLEKFFRFLSKEIEKYFEIKQRKFVYDEKKSAGLYFILKKKKEIIVKGPPINKIDGVNAFRKRHKHCVIKQGIVFAKERAKTFSQFMSELKNKNKKRIKEMSIVSLN